ncbi:hypothetical protein CAP37_08660 [Hydrogenophaga sp. IBVHS1]|nr:hypothetical protein CAP37_08660 [Hydrogenophaga sp. IBVHS1]
MVPSQFAAVAPDPECETIQQLGNYLQVRRLPDGSIAALQDLLFTRALFLGCTYWGWERRFCFSDRERAASEFNKLVSDEDIPEGWIARRPDRPVGATRR